jgi:hypothetical protein
LPNRSVGLSLATFRGGHRESVRDGGTVVSSLAPVDLRADASRLAAFSTPKRISSFDCLGVGHRQSRLGRSLLLDGVLDVLDGAFHLALGAVYLALLLELLVAGQSACDLFELAFDLVDYFAHCGFLTVADALGRPLEADSPERPIRSRTCKFGSVTSTCAKTYAIRVTAISRWKPRPRPAKSSHRLVRLARNCVSPLLERTSAMSTRMGVVLIAVMFVMFGGGGAYYGAKAADKNLT